MGILRKSKEVTFRKDSLDLWPPGAGKIPMYKLLHPESPSFWVRRKSMYPWDFPLNRARFCLLSIDKIHTSIGK